MTFFKTQYHLIAKYFLNYSFIFSRAIELIGMSKIQWGNTQLLDFCLVLYTKRSKPEKFRFFLVIPENIDNGLDNWCV